MAWEMNNDKPIYVQILEKIKLRVVSGFYPVGSKLPSVRELAAEAGVNPNTMQKAFMELERSGLIVTMRTSGRIVTEDEEMIQSVKEDIARHEIERFFEKMSEIGFSKNETIAFAEQMDKEEKQ